MNSNKHHDHDVQKRDSLMQYAVLQLENPGKPKPNTIADYILYACVHVPDLEVMNSFHAKLIRA